MADIMDGIKDIKTETSLLFLVVSIATIGFGEYYHSCWLRYIGIVLCCVSIPCTIFCIIYYTIHYCKLKRTLWEVLPQDKETRIKTEQAKLKILDKMPE